ncbi:MAG: hypothetical protein Q8898_14450 [Bacillota bacterium]|nr:hypothetical protein [Bacillota bacterium]
MKKIMSLIFICSLVSAFVLAGCGSTNKVSDGVKSMLSISNQLAKAIHNGDQAKVKEVGPQLEKKWATFEDEVKKDNKDSYGKIEKYLDPTVAGSEADTLDKEALNSLNTQLSQALKELASKTK